MEPRFRPSVRFAQLDVWHVWPSIKLFVLLINSCGATCFKKLFSLVSPSPPPVNQVIFFYDIVTVTLSILI